MYKINFINNIFKEFLTAYEKFKSKLYYLKHASYCSYTYF